MWYNRKPMVSPSKADFYALLQLLIRFFNLPLFRIKNEFLFINDLPFFHSIFTTLKLFTKFWHNVFVGLFGTCFSIGELRSTNALISSGNSIFFLVKAFENFPFPTT